MAKLYSAQIDIYVSGLTSPEQLGKLVEDIVKTIEEDLKAKVGKHFLNIYSEETKEQVREENRSSDQKIKGAL